MTRDDIPTCDGMGLPAADLPRYERIKKSILEHIGTNGLKPGDRLPTEAKLCRLFGWSRVTISRALNELAMEGVVTRVRGSGTYVAEKKITDRALRIMMSETALNPGKGYGEEVFAGIRESAAQQGVDVIYSPGDGIPALETVTNSNADGILLMAPNVEHIPAILRLREAGRPVVAMALRSRFGSLATVCTDNFGGMRQAVAHLAALGHRRIALATSGLTSSDVQERIEGFHTASFEAGISVDPMYLLLFDRRIESRVLKVWFESLLPPPTAMIVDRALAFPVQHLLWKKNMRVPGDVSLVVTDESDLFRGCDPQLTVIRQPLAEMGRRGVTKLIGMIRGKDAGKPEVLPMEFIVRSSLAPIKESK